VAAGRLVGSRAMRRLLTCAAAIAALALPPTASAGQPALEARAILPADATWTGQPVGGFSALLDAGHGRYWAMPDNGFGNKQNSTSFLLRVYQVRPNWETKRGGPGTVDIRKAVTLRDPDRQVPFPIVNETTPERLLTGGDFDIESMRIARDGTWWFGEEFGPFIVHTDATGKVLDTPTPTPGVFSPDNPYGRTANLARSNGFEGMAVSADGRTLYPILEGPVAGDDPLDRRVYEFDVRARRFTGRTWTYRMSRPDTLVSDATVLDRRHIIVLERDNAQGALAQWKRAFLIHTPGREAVLDKEQIVDLLNLRDRSLISLPARAGDFGLGDPFAFPYQTVEAVLPIGHDRLALVNDTNFGSMGRNPSLPDYSDFIGVEVPGLG
jgi:hypothetical protein